MTVRQRIALTILATGLLAALAAVLTVAVAIQRVEQETVYLRANAFLGRVVATYDNLLELHERRPEELRELLSSLLLFEVDTQLYLLDATGRVLVTTGQVALPPGFRVALGPVQQAAAAAAAPGSRPGVAYVMGDDPERMRTDALVAARALSRAVIRPGADAAGYLYLVVQPSEPVNRHFNMFRSRLAGSALAVLAVVLLLATALSAWLVAGVTRPLRQLGQEVDAATRRGLDEAGAAAANAALEAPPAGPGNDTGAGGRRDEFTQLREGFRTMLGTLRRQWAALAQLDQFRREAVSNLSHDLRSPLTATVTCLETLDTRWQADTAGDATRNDAREDDRRLVQIALRNTRNAARLVRALGDLAQLDEPSFRLQPQRLHLGEVLDDIVLRFASRAATQGVALQFEAADDAAAPVAEVDMELFERAIANLVDNALKFTPRGGRITLSAAADGAQVRVGVADTGCGIDPEDHHRLFDRLYKARASVAPATGEGGKGLGLAIVKRIVDLHQGSVALESGDGLGTRITIVLPAARPTAPQT